MPWGGFVAPADVPRPIVMKLNAALNKVFAMPSFRERISDLGSDLRGGTPEEFWEHVRKEYARWSDVATRANVRIEYWGKGGYGGKPGKVSLCSWSGEARAFRRAPLLLGA